MPARIATRSRQLSWPHPPTRLFMPATAFHLTKRPQRSPVKTRAITNGRALEGPPMEVPRPLRVLVSEPAARSVIKLAPPWYEGVLMWIVVILVVFMTFGFNYNLPSPVVTTPLVAVRPWPLNLMQKIFTLPANE